MAAASLSFLAIKYGTTFVAIIRKTLNSWNELSRSRSEAQARTYLGDPARVSGIHHH